MTSEKKREKERKAKKIKVMNLFFNFFQKSY